MTASRKESKPSTGSRGPSMSRAARIRAAIAHAGSRSLLQVVQFDDRGLIPAIVQDQRSKRVLTLCYLNREALERSLAEGKIYLFRRSQQRLMLKGELSGHIQIIKKVEVDCEGKSLLFHVDQHVAGCHVGYFSCYFRHLDALGQLATTERRVFDPDKTYRNS